VTRQANAGRPEIIVSAGPLRTPLVMRAETPTEQVTVIKEEFWGVLDIYALSDTPHYRIVQNKFNYDYLAERKAASNFENFRLVAADLARFATSAVRSDGFTALANDGIVAQYADAKIFDEENRWRLQFLKQ
jgi:hypothetical protein